MPQSPIDVVRAMLANPTDLQSVKQLVAPDATYVSLNYDDPELRRIMPWVGTQTGPEAVVSTRPRRRHVHITLASKEPSTQLPHGPLQAPMAQVVTVRSDWITEFRPFYWNVPVYQAAVEATVG